MRMRKRPNLEPRMQQCGEYLISNPEQQKGHWKELMPQARELRVEVGCGKGGFTVKTAQAEPDVLLIAIERVREAMVLAMEKAKRLGLKNVFFVSMDVANLAQCFVPGEIDLLYINFCDPWPRSKHAKRRLTFHTFLAQYAMALKPGGRIAFKTDNADLFEWSVEQFRENGWELTGVTRDLHERGIQGIMTDYEEKFHTQGVPICRLEAINSDRTRKAEL